MVAGFKHALGTSLLHTKKDELSSLLWMRQTAPQVMAQLKGYICNLTTTNALVTRDTFILRHDVKNVTNKMSEDLWERHLDDSEGVRL